MSLLLDGGNYLGRRFVRVPGIRERFAARFRQVLDEVLTEPVVLSYVEQRAARVKHDLGVDQERWQRSVAPEEAFDVIREFVVERPKILRAALDATYVPAGADADDSASAEETEELPH